MRRFHLRFLFILSLALASASSAHAHDKPESPFQVGRSVALEGLTTNGAAIVPSPLGSSVMTRVATQWLRYDLDESGHWHGPVVSATPSGSSEVVGWKVGTDQEIAVLGGENIRAASPSLIEAFQGNAQQWNSSARNDPSLRSTYMDPETLTGRLYHALPGHPLANSKFTATQIGSTLLIDYNLPDTEYYMEEKWVQIYDVSHDGERMLYRFSGDSPLTCVNLIDGSTNTYPLHGHHGTHHQEGVFSPNGAMVLVKSMYDEERVGAEPYYGYLQVFSVDGDFITEIAGVGPIGKYQCGHDMAWLKTGWLVYSTCYDLVFTKVKMMH